MWNGSGTDLLDAAERAGAWRHILVLLGAGVVTGLGQIVLRQLSSGNGIDTTAAIWFHAGRMPAWRTLGSALLSVVIVGMGVSLGREGAPKQAGAVIANFFSDQSALVRRTTPAFSGLRRGRREWARHMACLWAARFSRWK
jgi:CIC family chloride channel protein